MKIMAVADIIKALKMERNKLTIAALIARCSERLRGLSVHAIGRNQDAALQRQSQKGY
jgi:hypothetical protein